MKNMSNKSLDKSELAIRDSIISGYDRIKLASIIYGVSNSKGGGLGYHQITIQGLILSETIKSFFFKHYSKGVE